MILQGSVVMELLLAAAFTALCCFLAYAVYAAWIKKRRGVLLQRYVWKGRSLWLWLLPFFVCGGMWRAQQARDICSRELLMGLDGKIVEVRGNVMETDLKADWAVLVLENCEVWSASGAKELGSLGRIQIYAESTAAAVLPGIGNLVRARGECAAFETARNPGEFDYRLYYRSLKLNYRMFASSYEVADGSRDVYRDSLRRVSVWASARLELLVGKEDAGIFRAVLLGDKSGLPENIRDMYQKNGIAHLLAVSGLHLSLVSLAVYTLLRRLGAGYGAAGVVGGGVLFSYALLTGASPSVVRALIMVLCGFWAAYLGRTYDLLSALLLSALWLFWDSPYLLTQAGVQLSFGAVIGIGGLVPCLYRGMGENGKGFFFSVSMQLVTLPLILFHFFQFPLYSIFLNLLVVPLMGIVLASGSAALAFGSLSLEAGRFAAGSGCAVLGWYEWCCGVFERLPGSNVIMGRPKLWQIGIYYGILTAAALLIKKSGDCRQEEKKFPAPVLSFILCLLFAVLLPHPVSGLEVTFLDVGQGDGICLRTGRTVVMTDGGSSDQKKLGEGRMEPFLKSRGIRKVDYWVVSHGDQDHISGLLWIFENPCGITVKNLVLPAAGYGNEAYEVLVRLAKERGTRVEWMERGDGLQLGRLTLTCLYPEGTAEDPLPASADRNEHSLVLRTDYDAFHMLLTGDMSGEGETRLLQLLKQDKTEDALRGIEVLKIAHHGSRYSTTAEWLDTVKPEWAVVSYGEENRYGHPHGETMERLAERDIQVFETAKTGAMILYTDGACIRWTSWLDRKRKNSSFFIQNPV